ncbi:unnamed protein product [Cylindrotheca closterium]|uniref:C3H1-type domain-containing protein n=1 Tax=Cylindrotheca closterium TaxID=2856 RepID=A0AAD2FQ72_9STRA|nr:unnamed protein product [Cylindrotheca closterium]
MTIIGYSGRGRGREKGRGRGRGWGRGGDRGRSVTYQSYAGGQGRGRGRFSYRYQQQQLYSASSGNSGNPSHKWVRNGNEATNAESNGNLGEEKSTQEQDFVKRGKNQLILKTDKPSGLYSEKNEESSTKTSSDSKMDGESIGKPESEHTDSQLPNTSTFVIIETETNKLISSGSRNDTSREEDKPDAQSSENKMEDKVDTTMPSQPSSSQKPAPNRPAVSELKVNSIGNRSAILGADGSMLSTHLKKVASHKLVASGASSKPGVPARRTNHPGPPHWKSGNTKKRPPPRSGRPRPGAAKRIAIEVTNKASGEQEQPITQDGSTANEGSLSSEPTEKLTDFAYRQTSARVQRGNDSKSLKWSANGGSTVSSSIHQSGRPLRRNMGLVRVQPNTGKTPICKTFLRGINCTDKYCKKRHDIPKEFSVPVCSFFQRHGNCLKGESCPFRHIKVNPRAMVCPSFAVLGFCDDPDCNMKHERSKPKK